LPKSVVCRGWFAGRWAAGDARHDPQGAGMIRKALA
jgi:hypothetical protein